VVDARHDHRALDATELPPYTFRESCRQCRRRASALVVFDRDCRQVTGSTTMASASRSLGAEGGVLSTISSAKADQPLTKRVTPCKRKVVPRVKRRMA
jgi:hypothetical protein